MWTRRPFELALCAGFLFAAGTARAQPGDPMAAFRERFHHGMDRYEARDFADAIADWEPIFAELGPQKGYRLAYDLGVAYHESGDAAHALERLQAFITEAAARRTRGDTLEPIVVKEEADAQARLAVLAPVAPSPPAPQPRAPDSAPAPAPALAPAPEPALAPAPEPALAPLAQPRSIALPVIIGTGGGLALASALTAIPLDAHAQSLHNQYVVEQTQSATHSISASDRQAFSTARTLAYAAIGGAAGFGGATAAVAAWYLFGPSRREGASTALIGPEPHGASMQLTAWF
jgi:hypothetical protein